MKLSAECKQDILTLAPSAQVAEPNKEKQYMSTAAYLMYVPHGRVGKGYIHNHKKKAN
jgi:hypothetical protein